MPKSFWDSMNESSKNRWKQIAVDIKGIEDPKEPDHRARVETCIEPVEKEEK